MLKNVGTARLHAERKQLTQSDSSIDESSSQTESDSFEEPPGNVNNKKNKV